MPVRPHAPARALVAPWLATTPASTAVPPNTVAAILVASTVGMTMELTPMTLRPM
ncbi:hypothetical protein JOF56_009036 [Kibdelosporangium banguiense]|uniref:Uncharacterized protein n=1 Tax=Kibdelosporangium banguiense TaxID=1365924 RepID=A0ABS4TW67_9PSEU|nr:hypothetical protein [Kibdelosporangium banguiense]MBP2328651.1 hypothetical protein [Kibdelosporangium banguiense]